jgi:hypothetical protein
MRAVMLLTCALGLSACIGSGSDQGALRADDVSDDVGGGDEGEEEVCEVDPDAIGVVGVVPTHGTTLEVVKWISRRGTRDEYVGFELSRQARFTVLAGGEAYPAEGTGWTHPQGNAGAVITGIDFCDDYCEDEGDDGGGGDDNDDPPVVD